MARLSTQRDGQSTLNEEVGTRVHVGVDLHQRTSQLAVLNNGGELPQHRLANDPRRVREFFAELPPARVALEASSTWWWRS